MSAALVSGLLAGYGVAIPVGAVAAYLVTLIARTSLRVGIAAALGVATADGLYALLAVLGGAALSAPITAAAAPLRWASAVVLLVVAARTAASALLHRPQSRDDQEPAVTGPAHVYLRLALVTLVNPTTVVYFAAFVAGARAGARVSLSEQLVFVLAAFTASASWQTLLAGSGALLGRSLTSPRVRLATALISSAVIAALALRLALR